MGLVEGLRGSAGGEGFKQTFVSGCLILVIMFAAGCTTMRRDSQFKVTPVLSTPPGATIELNGKVIGQTPSYIHIPRSSDNGVLKLKLNGETQESEVVSRYRWKDSLFSNLVFFGYAPIGWVWDWANDSAYEMELGASEFIFPKQLDRQGGRKAPIKTIVILPPQGIDGLLGQELGRKIAKWVGGKFPDSKIINFDESEDVFREEGLDNFSFGNEVQQRSVFGFFKASHGLYVTTETQNEKITASVGLKDAVSLKLVKSAKVTWPLSEFKSEKEKRLVKKWKDRLYWIPNTVTLESGGVKSNVEIDGTEYDAIQFKEDGFVNEVLSVVGAFGLKYQQAGTRRKSWRWGWMLTPSVSANSGSVKFENGPGIENLVVKSRSLVVGYGPEGFYESSYGRLYLSFLPGFGYQQLTYGTEGSSFKILDGGYFGLITELGFLHHIDHNWSVRAFARYTQSNLELWKEIIDERSPGKEFKGAGINYGGVAIGYRLPLLNWFEK